MNKRTKPQHKDKHKPWYNKTREQAWKIGFIDGVKAEQAVNSQTKWNEEHKKETFCVERLKIVNQLVSNVGQTLIEVNELLKKI